jgi:hypothetical protein
MFASAVAEKAKLEEKIDRMIQECNMKAQQKWAKAKAEALKKFDLIYKEAEKCCKNDSTQNVSFMFVFISPCLSSPSPNIHYT